MISLVFPCLNPTSEQWNKLSTFINELRHNSSIQFELIVVDDGSTKWIAPPKELEKSLLIHRLSSNAGKGGALKVATRIFSQKSSVFAFLDFDLPFSTQEVLGVCSAVIEGCDLCIGDRTLLRQEDVLYRKKSSNRISRNFAHILFRLIVRMLITGGVPDTQCGIKAYRADMVRRIAEKSKINGFLFDVEWIYIALRHRLALRCWPVQVQEEHESSTLRSFGFIKPLNQLWTLFTSIVRRDYEDEILYGLARSRREQIKNKSAIVNGASVLFPK